MSGNIINVEIKRGDKQYTDVEAFEDYEFTECIAYEMAIRNKDVINLVKNILVNWGSSSHEYILLKEYGIDFAAHTDYYWFKDENIIANQHYNQDVPAHERITETTDCNYGHTKSFAYSLHHMPLREKGELIYQSFKRPLIRHVSFMDIEPFVSINVNLPEKDLIAYVKHIKKYYDDRAFPTDGLEGLIHHDFRDSEKDRILSNKTKMADLFFVYDCKSLKYSNQKIRNKYYDYYSAKGIETKTLDAKTIKTYYEIGIEYIDNKKYLELVTNRKLNS